MLIDLNTMDDNASLEVDHCIVGAGPAGITLALKLAQAGHQVLILEGGGLMEEPVSQALYKGSVSDSRLHSPPDNYRQRRLGGSTTIWGGRCMPFDPIDFETRTFMPHSGWPISYESLAPFYAEANKWCEAGEYDYSAASTFGDKARAMIADFSPECFTSDSLERFSCPTDFGTRYRHRLVNACNIRVILHANVTNIELSETGTRVVSMQATSLSGRKLLARAKHYVLATGGLETARLLLANRTHHAHGIGNSHDNVGRYYMCHLAGTAGTLRLNRPLGSIWHGYQISDDGIYCRRRLALRDSVQRQLGIGNFIARLHHPRITLPEHRSSMLSMLFLARPFIPYEYAKRLHGDDQVSLRERLRHVVNVLADPLDAGVFAWQMLKDRKLADRKFPSVIFRPKAPVFSIDFHAEQEPNPQSRITLNQERDALGMLRINVDWRYTSTDVNTVKQSMSLLATDFSKTGAGMLEYDPDSLEDEMTRYGAYGGHHIGTARMGANPRTSVVNEQARLHDVDNLYAAGSAIFPTSSQANPTLTIVALALRLADHLKRQHT